MDGSSVARSLRGDVVARLPRLLVHRLAQPARPQVWDGQESERGRKEAHVHPARVAPTRQGADMGVVGRSQVRYRVGLRLHGESVCLCER